MGQLYLGGEQLQTRAKKDMKRLAKAIERVKASTAKGLAKRKIWDKIGDVAQFVGNKFIPGLGNAIDLAIDQVSAHNIKLGDPEALRKAGGFYTQGIEEDYAKEQEKIISESKGSFLDSLLREGVEFAGSKAGEKVLGGLEAKGKEFMGKAKGFISDKIELAEEAGISSRIASEQALLPKSGIGRIDLGDIPEFEMAGKPMAITPTDMTPMKTMKQRFEGMLWDDPEYRINPWETGEGSFRSLSEKYNVPTFDPETGEAILEMEKYYGGGIVQGSSPTISDYFSKQGKTLGGSNKQSLAEMLGRR